MSTIKHVGYTLTPDGIFTGTAEQWFHLGPLLVQLGEVREVRFTDKEPCRHNADFVWWLNSGDCLMRYDLPAAWFADRQGYQKVCYATREEALAAASRGAIAWARKEAGLL